MNKLLKLFITKILGNKVIFPFYHLVSDQECPHIRHLYPVKRISTFEKELDFFQRNFQPITWDEILNHVINDSQPKKPSFFLSFDDGLSECSSIIAPILKQRNLEAAFFVNTDFVDNQALFFRYKVSLLIDKTEKSKFNVHYSKNELLQLRYCDTEKINLIAERLEVDFNDFLKSQQPYMNWSEIKNLRNEGFVIGSHSSDHPLYSDISLQQQIHQTKTSMDILAENLDLKQRIFSFPFTDDGVGNSFFDFVFDTNLIDLSFGTAGIKDDVYSRNIQRLPMDLYSGRPEYFVLKNILLYRFKRILKKNKVVHPSI